MVEREVAGVAIASHYNSGITCMWLFLLLLLGMPTPARAETRDITFPVIGNVNYTDDFGAPRSGHSHEGNDLLGSKGLPLVAAVSGRVRYVAYPEPDYGYYVSIQDEEGYSYVYIHINNDTPATDDGQGGGRNAYAPYIEDGADVVAGQLIGWMGDSGNAESTTPHLHFEIRLPDGSALDPYETLQAAAQVGVPTIAPQLDDEILPFGEFTGGAHIAMGNFDSDEPLEVVVGAGPGGGPNVRVYDQDGAILHGFFAYGTDFHGGVDVAAGDIDGDGRDEIITGAGPGGGPQVRIFTPAGKALSTWYAYDPTFPGGLSVAAADVTGDGRAEIITGPGAGGGPQVRVLRSDGRPLYQFMAYDENFRGGVDVAARPQTDTQNARIITAPGPGDSPEVRVFRVNGGLITKFFAYDSTFTGGVRLAVSNIDIDTKATEIVTVPADHGGVNIRMFNLRGTFLEDETEFEEWWTGGFDIAAGESNLFISSGPTGRRASVREVRSSYY